MCLCYIYTISVPPNIIDESSSSETLATEGRAVTLNCDATGTPKVTIINMIIITITNIIVIIVTIMAVMVTSDPFVDVSSSSAPGKCSSLLMINYHQTEKYRQQDHENDDENDDDNDFFDDDVLPLPIVTA